LFHVGVCFKSLASQVLLEASRQLEITGREIGTLGSMIHFLQAVGLRDKTHFHLDARGPS